MPNWAWVVLPDFLNIRSSLGFKFRTHTLKGPHVEVLMGRILTDTPVLVEQRKSVDRTI